MSAEENLKKLGLTLPPVPKPIGSYVPFRRDGSTLRARREKPHSTLRCRSARRPACR